MKLFPALLCLSVAIAAEDAPKPEQSKPPVITADQKLPLKDLEGKIWKQRSDRAEYLTQSQNQENMMIQQYSLMYQKLVDVCGKDFHLDEQLNCVVGASPQVPVANAAPKPAEQHATTPPSGTVPPAKKK